MARLGIRFTMPSDADADGIAVAIAETAAEAVTNANAKTFAKMKRYSAGTTNTIYVYSLADGTQLTKDTRYYFIASPFDTSLNFNTDYDADDVVSGLATGIYDVAAAAGSFEATLVSILKADSTVQANVSKDQSGIDYEIYPTGYHPVGNRFPQLTYEFDEGPSEDAIPAGRRSLKLIYWVKKSQSEAFSKIKTVTDKLNELVNRSAGDYQSVNEDTNTGYRVAGIIKTGGGIDFDEEHNCHTFELIYDIIISEEESFAAATSGEADWI